MIRSRAVDQVIRSGEAARFARHSVSVATVQEPVGSDQASRSKGSRATPHFA